MGERFLVVLSIKEMSVFLFQGLLDSSDSIVCAPVLCHSKPANGKFDSQCNVSSLSANTQVYNSPSQSSHFHTAQLL